MFETYLFDLDGTIADSGLGITNSVIYALKKYNIEVKNRSDLYYFIGPPLHESFRKTLNCSEEESMRAVAYYREYYAETGIFEDEIYAGIPELLEELCRAGKQVVLATSKPEQYAKRILEHFHLAQYFTVAAGSNMDGTRTKKAEVIRYAMEQCKAIPQSTLMIGDREHDILGAGEVGIKSCGVLWGYGDAEELTRAGADWIVEKPEEIRKLSIQ
jgi:phosphoglycolate phosphatase